MTNPTWLYVAAVYAAAVWLARRAGIPLRWRIATFFYALVLLFLWRPMTGPWVNIPVDFIQTLPPWTYLSHLSTGYQVGNSELNDLVLQITPWAHQVRESWRALEAPLWNQFAGSGYPLHGNGQSSALSPLRLLAIPLPLGYAMTAEAAWKILIALTFTFLYCRRRDYSELASAIGAICFGFSTFIITWLHFPLVTVACMLPAALYALDLLLERRTFGRFTFAAALWAVMLFGGHPETVSHTFFISLLALLWTLFAERPFATKREAWRAVLTLGGALTVAALLAAPFLAPLAEAITKSKRFHELQASPNVVGYYSDWASGIVLVQPHFFGAIPFEQTWGPAGPESMTGFAGVLGIGAWLALLVHVVRTRSWRSRETFFVIATVMVVGIIMAWPGISTLFHLVFKIAANARLRLILALLLAVQTAAVIDLLQRHHVRVALLAPLGAGAALLFILQTFDFPARDHYLGALAAMAPSLCTLLAVSLAALLAPRWRDFGIMIVAVLALNELWAIGRGWNTEMPSSLMYPKTPMIEKLVALKEQQPANAPFRIVGAGPVFFPNVAAMYGLEDIRAHDPMASGRYLGLLRVIAGYTTDEYFARWENATSPLIDFLNVKYFVAPPGSNMPDPERWPLVYDGRDGRLFQNRDVLPRFFHVDNVVLEFRKELFVQRLREHRDWAYTAILDRLEVENDRMRDDFLKPRAPNAPRAAATIVSAHPTRYHVRVEAPRYTLVASSIPWWPGWKVTRNGQRIEPIRVNGAFLGFAVPPGTTDVRVWFAPWSYWGGVWVSLLTLAGLTAFRVQERRMKKFNFE